MLSLILVVLLLVLFYLLVSEVLINSDVFIINPWLLGEIFVARTSVGQEFLADISDSLKNKKFYWAYRGVADPAAYNEWMTFKLPQEWSDQPNIHLPSEPTATVMSKDTPDSELQRQFFENRFIGMMTILVISGGALFFEFISEHTWQYTSLFALAIFSGAKVFDAQNLAILPKTSKKPEESK